MLCVFIVLLLIGQSSPKPKLPSCDESRTDLLHEGNIGETKNFPWLGVLRVHLHEYETLRIALTGIILVKYKYAIANAQDLSKIPKILFLQDSKAMFLPADGEPWFSRPVDYMLHPEYEYSTYNTIALVELEIEQGTVVPFKPVCWPGDFFNTSNQLYALGYTDENKLLEKTIYPMQYVKPHLCKEFYNRVGFSEPKSEPMHTQCGFASTNLHDCVWENGMALASNSSGKWTLIGFGVRGPGCSAPARFIDMSAYFPWIESATDLEQVKDYPDFRRKTAFNLGFRRQSSSKEAEDADEDEHEVTDFPTMDPRLAIDERYPGYSQPRPRYKIYRLQPGQHAWWELPLKLEQAGFESSAGCTIPKLLVYRDRFRLVDAEDSGGMFEYRVSLYDTDIYNYTCIKLKIRNLQSLAPVIAWFSHDIDPVEGTGFWDVVGETPVDLLKYYPSKKMEITDPPDKKMWVPGKHLKPQYIFDKRDHKGIENINIIIGFSYIGKAFIDLQVFGLPHRRPPTTPKPDDFAKNKTKKTFRYGSEETEDTFSRKMSRRENRPRGGVQVGRGRARVVASRRARRPTTAIPTISPYVYWQ